MSGDGKRVYSWIANGKFTRLHQVAERMLDRDNGKPCQRQCRMMTSEYICQLLNESRLTAYGCRENARSRQRQNLSETVSGRRQESICMKTDSEVTKLNKVAQRVLDPANGKPCQRERRAMASEYIRELLIGILRSCLMLQREYSIEPTANPVRDCVGRWQVSMCVDC